MPAWSHIDYDSMTWRETTLKPSSFFFLSTLMLKHHLSFLSFDHLLTCSPHGYFLCPIACCRCALVRMEVLPPWQSCAPSVDVWPGRPCFIGSYTRKVQKDYAGAASLWITHQFWIAFSEVLAEYVWLDADGVTRSKTMTMTARSGAWREFDCKKVQEAGDHCLYLPDRR